MKFLIKKIGMANLLLVGGLCFSQSKVGINIENPEYTLDVEGSVRLVKPGEDMGNSVLLGINPTNRQVVKLPSFKKREVFDKRVNMMIPVEIKQRFVEYNVGGRRGSIGPIFSFVETIDHNLNINPAVYTAFILSADLVEIDSNGNNRGVQMKAIALSSGDTNFIPGGPKNIPREQWNNRITNIKVRKVGTNILASNDGEHLLKSTAKNSGPQKITNYEVLNPFLYESPIVFLDIKDGKWMFNARYSRSGPITQNKLAWRVNLFLIKKKWLQSVDNVKMVVHGDNSDQVRCESANCRYPIVN